MSPSIQIDRFTRLKLTVSGQFSPTELPRLADFLAGMEGEINFELSGKLFADAAGSQKRLVKCIISGWFLLIDPATLQPIRHDVDIDSRLVIVSDESMLPALEAEADDEDYIVCGAEMDIRERVEEEILLDLPQAAVANLAGVQTMASERTTQAARDYDAELPVRAEKVTGTRILPFAKLAEWKNKAK